MVNTFTTILGLTTAVTAIPASATPMHALARFDVPAFDYTALDHGDTPARLLEALQADGIVALKNIPNYANLHERYLREAAQCAGVKASVAHDPFVSRKLFADGTQRTTISTNAGRELSGSAAEVDARCPGYRQLYEEFSRTLERAVNTFGSTLDKTSFTASDGHKTISSRQLIGEAIRLDHFHAYEPSASSRELREVDDATHRELELSLPLHEDHGLFIAMSAPKFFAVKGGRELEERKLAADASGLVIQRASGERVRPVLKSDELVLMMGTGASRWLKTSHALPAVMHGMKMPEGLITREGERSLRAWFGKMTLLPSYQRMLLNNGQVFETHVNATTRYLLSNQETDLKTVGCATGRRLTPSEGKCTAKVCKVKAGASAPAEACSVICNRENHSEDDAPECAAKCECTQGSAGERCWMLCVANLPSDQCAPDKQTCKDQKLVCTAAPTPTTTAPAPSPTTTAPPPGPSPTTTKPAGSSPTPTTTAPGATPSPGAGPTPPSNPPSTTAPGPSTPGSTTKAPTPGSPSSSPGASPASSSPAPTTSSSGSNADGSDATTEPGTETAPAPGSSSGSAGSAETNPQTEVGSTGSDTVPSTPESSAPASSASSTVVASISAVAAVVLASVMA